MSRPAKFEIELAGQLLNQFFRNNYGSAALADMTQKLALQGPSRKDEFNGAHWLLNLTVDADNGHGFLDGRQLD
ncbi:MAG: hypothetical protein DME33_12085 [Verrucomicrobia bacterium]|nr:MAG: hypothetical protein DME33_12085 [Verrucomicrobiota bacterium]